MRSGLGRVAPARPPRPQLGGTSSETPRAPTRRIAEPPPGTLRDGKASHPFPYRLRVPKASYSSHRDPARTRRLGESCSAPDGPCNLEFRESPGFGVLIEAVFKRNRLRDRRSGASRPGGRAAWVAWDSERAGQNFLAGLAGLEKSQPKRGFPLRYQRW